jgi:nucleotide-binding universal stress UspA family protein
MTDIHRILVPTDGSGHAAKALDFAIGLARQGPRVEIHLLNVQPPVHGIANTLIPHGEIDAYHREEGMKVLAGPESTVTAAGLTPHKHIGVGVTAETILAFADRLGCEQIVMGTSGLGGVAGLLLGSVARDVAGGAKVPVTLLR